jgi:hypothetical protein
MVLVAPHPTRPAPGAVAARPLSGGSEVLSLLRAGAATRPRFDPGLAGGLRAWLEDAAYGAAADRGDGSGPLVLGTRRLLGTAAGGWGDEAETEGTGDERVVGDEQAVDTLVHALFRQLVHAGTIGDPLGDALDALAVEASGELVDRIESLARAERAWLAETVASHAAQLAGLVPRFAPGWLPRTDDRIAIPLAGGRVVLHGVADLLVGVPHPGVASLCLLGLTTSGPWARERRSLHFLALLETLRSGTPPFRLALLESATGRYRIEDVREEHLRAMASHVCAWLAGPDASHG